MKYRQTLCFFALILGIELIVGKSSLFSLALGDTEEELNIQSQEKQKKKNNYHSFIEDQIDQIPSSKQSTVSLSYPKVQYQYHITLTVDNEDIPISITKEKVITNVQKKKSGGFRTILKRSHKIPERETILTNEEIQDNSAIEHTFRQEDAIDDLMPHKKANENKELHEYDEPLPPLPPPPSNKTDDPQRKTTKKSDKKKKDAINIESAKKALKSLEKLERNDKL